MNRLTLVIFGFLLLPALASEASRKLFLGKRSLWFFLI